MDKARLDQATIDEACDGESDLFSSLQKWKTVDPAEAISYFASNDLSDIDRKILSMHKDAVSAIPNIKGVSDAVVSLAKLREKYFLYLASVFTEAALNVDFPLDGLKISGEGWKSRNNPSVPHGVLQEMGRDLEGNTVILEAMEKAMTCSVAKVDWAEVGQALKILAPGSSAERIPGINQKAEKIEGALPLA